MGENKKTRKRMKLVLSGILAGVLAFSLSAPVSAEGIEETVSAVPASSSEAELAVSTIRAEGGNTVDITLSLSNANDVGAMEYQLVYDADMLTCNDVKTASFDGVTSLNQEKGRISFAAASSKKVSYQKDTVLMTMNFTVSSGAGKGEKAEIYLEHTKLYQSGGAKIPLSIKNGFVEVSPNGNTPQTDGSYLTGIVPESTVFEVNTKLGQNAIWTNAQGGALSGNDTVKTGDKVSFGGKTYEVVIRGDLNGDGKISSLDTVKIRQHILGRTDLSGPYKKAADCNKDSKIDSLDVVKIRNHILGRAEIVQ